MAERKVKQATMPTKKTKKPKAVLRPDITPRVKKTPLSPVAETTKVNTGILSGVKSFAERLHVVRIVTSSRFAKVYVGLALLLLLASTVFWGVLGALVHQGNADQLVDSYLFENAKTFHGALFPDAHTFLLKWPLFVAMKFMGLSAASFGVCTMLLVLATVGAFAFLLYRIERRPLVLGTWYLALASVLLLVPAQPYPGGMLPVNMAMITTRNIEYIFYLGSLVLILRARRWLDWRLIIAVVLLAILAASDRLFIDMSLGGAVIMLGLFALRRARWHVVLAARWLAVSLLAFAGAFGISAVIRWLSITHVSINVGAGPFGLVHSLHDIMLGSVYAGLGLLSDFGANPAAYTSLLRQIPHEALHGLANVGALTYMINFGVFVTGILLAGRFVWRSLKKPAAVTDADAEAHSAAAGLSFMLLVTAVASLGLFVASNHYYPVDARYLQIAVFALFVIAVTYLRHREWLPQRIALVGLLLIVGIGCGLVPAWHNYRAEKVAMQTVNSRNRMAASILGGHHATVLVGDYWRVMPTKLEAGGKLQVMPLTSCTQAQDILSSQTWNIDLRHQKFAYLLTLDHATLTGYAQCTLQQVIAMYGRPNSSTLVAGTPTNPQELLLFFDQGTDAAKQAATRIAAKKAAPPTDTVLPVPVSGLPYTTCSAATIMNVVAHQDDDLLFINPDTLHDIQAGNCLRSVYITAGDAGEGETYWLSREKGIEAAYSAMLGISVPWVQRTVTLPTGQYLTVANPYHSPQVTLIFMRLPDGNLSGQGFKATHYASITRLYNGNLPTIRSVDGQSTYTAPQIVETLATLMDVYGPREVRTQSTLSSTAVRDHSDHRTVGYLTSEAFQVYNAKIKDTSIAYYRGYPVRGLAQNVIGPNLDAKLSVFLAYSKYDDGVCHTEEECANPHNNYSAYLRREYTSTH